MKQENNNTKAIVDLVNDSKPLQNTLQGAKDPADAVEILFQAAVAANISIDKASITSWLEEILNASHDLDDAELDDIVAATGITRGLGILKSVRSSLICDRNAKEDFRHVDVQDILNKLVKMQLLSWKYKSQDPAIRHIGPMAQDFKVIFGIGESDTSISSVDAHGVAMAAIQGLNQKLELENAQLRERLERLERLFCSVSTAQPDGHTININ